jgi:hypothetical protein
MFKTGLTAYWIAFPQNPHSPHGFGVTAWTEDDAFHLLEQNGYMRFGSRIDATIRSVRADEIDAQVARNSGPIVVRGIWYPALNVGFGAPGHSSSSA